MHQLSAAARSIRPTTGSTPRPAGRPVRVALLDDCEVVTAGLRQLLAPHRDLQLVPATPHGTAADLVLFDPALPGDSDRGERLRRLLNAGVRVVLFTWDAHRAVAEQALADGVRGCLSKTLPGGTLVGALRRIVRGQVVVDWGESTPTEADDLESAAERSGVSRRELEVLELIGCGLTNEDIAGRLFLSPNSIKSYIRSAYRKIGVERRAQAVLWVHQHGFEPDAVLAAPVAPGGAIARAV